MHFLRFSNEIFESFLKTFTNNFVFRQNARKFNAGFEIILKIYQNNAFLLFPKEIFESFLKVSPNNCVFLPKREILTQDFYFFEKSPKIIHFLQFSYEIFLKCSKFSGVRGAPPPDLLRGRPRKMSPLNRNPGGAAVMTYECSM